MDQSNGYENIAEKFIKVRGQTLNGIGAGCVRLWVQSLPRNSSVLDLGCGSGIPLTKVIVDEGMQVYGIDASQSLVTEFQKNLPDIFIACEPVEESTFFNQKFDAILAWGLLFLLPETVQMDVLHKVSNALEPGGKFLFTAPYQKAEWQDLLTGRISTSLGAKIYKKVLNECGVRVVEEFYDEGDNHYFSAIKK